jgi:hypothetical protein
MADEARAEMRRRGFALCERPASAARALAARRRIVRLRQRPEPDPLVTMTTTVGDGSVRSDDLFERLRAAGLLVQREQLQSTNVASSSAEIAPALLVAAREDASFGWTVAVGLGGKFSDLLRRAAIRRPPITVLDVQDMFEELGLSSLLTGLHGGPAVEPEQVAAFANQLASVAATLDQIGAVELNPLALSTDGNLVALDAATATKR